MAPPFERSHVCDFNFSTTQSAQLSCWCFGRNKLYINADTTAKIKRISTVRQIEQKTAADTGHGVYEMVRAFV